MELAGIISLSSALLAGRGGRAEERWVQWDVFPGCCRSHREPGHTAVPGRAALGASQPVPALPGPGAPGSVLGSWDGGPGSAAQVWERNQVPWRLPAWSLRGLLHPGKLAIQMWLWIPLGNEIQAIPELSFPGAAGRKMLFPLVSEEEFSFCSGLGMSMPGPGAGDSPDSTVRALRVWMWWKITQRCPQVQDKPRSL